MLKGVCGSAKHRANGFQPKGKQAAGPGHLADGSDEQRAKRGANAEGCLRECGARSKRLSTIGPAKRPGRGASLLADRPGHLANGK